MSTEKPHVIACSCGLSGHLRPVLGLCKGLLQRGFDVTVVSSSSARLKVEEAGAEFQPLSGVADFDDSTVAEQARLLKSGESDRPVLDLGNEYVDAMPIQFEAIKKSLRPNSVVISEILFFGAHFLSSEIGPDKKVPWIALGTMPLYLRSWKTRGLDLDQSEEAHQRKIAMYHYVENVIYKTAIENYRAMHERMGFKRPDSFLMEHAYLAADKVLQLCPPSLEFPRVDLPEQFVYAGSLRHPQSSETLPDWWPELAEKRVVGVCQGTYSRHYEQLLIPTIMALKDEDVLTVAILGKHGASLDIELPSNCRVIDYLSYDKILPYCESFVFNGGYGGVQHCIVNGVPVIIGGESEDKPFVAVRAKAAGIAIDLNSATPSQKQIRDAAREIHEDPSFKQHALRMKKESDALDPVAILEKSILELAK